MRSLSPADLVATLSSICDGLKHGSTEVRKHNLQRLLHILYTQQLCPASLEREGQQSNLLLELYTVLLGERFAKMHCMLFLSALVLSILKVILIRGEIYWACGFY